MPPSKTLKIALIGARGGIGSELARLFAEQGYTNVRQVVRKAKPYERARFGKKSQDVVDFVPADTHVVINVAGVSQAMLAVKCNAAAATHIIGETIGPVADSVFRAAEYMMVEGFGRIINVSSVLAHKPVRGVAAYAAAKAAVEAYTRAVSVELAPYATANTIALGYFDAGMTRQVSPEFLHAAIDATPAERLGNVEEDLFGLIEFLISSDAKFITGQTLHVNGGLYAGK